MDLKEFDALGDRCKAFEAASTMLRFIPGVPMVVRLDGRAFHTFTRKIKAEKPFDKDFQLVMQITTKKLVSEFKPLIGYTQSDEITLVFDHPEDLFGGRRQKIESVMAGLASSTFTLACLSVNPVKFGLSLPISFDARAFQVSGLNAALGCLIWREADAVKNSISMVAQANFSPKQLHGKGRKDMLDMLHEKGIGWNRFDPHSKRGIYIKRETITRLLTDEERAKIPAKHQPTADHPVVRTEVRVLDVPPIQSLADPLSIFYPETTRFETCAQVVQREQEEHRRQQEQNSSNV